MSKSHSLSPIAYYCSYFVHNKTKQKLKNVSPRKIVSIRIVANAQAKVHRHQDDAGHSPHQNGHQPRCMPERTPILVHNPLAQQLATNSTCRPNQRNRNNILNARSGIRPSKSHQTLHIIRIVSHQRRRHNRQQRKQQIPQHKIVRIQPRRIQKQRLQIIPQRNRDDRKTRRQRENRKQRQKVLDKLQQPRCVARLWHEIQRVHVLQIGKRKGAGQRQTQIEHADDEIVE